MTITNRTDQISVGEALDRLMVGGVPFRFTAYDGSTAGPDDSPIHVRLLNERGLSYILSSPGDLGMARAYVAGDLEMEGAPPGNPYEAMVLLQNNLRFRMPSPTEAFQLARGHRAGRAAATRAATAGGAAALAQGARGISAFARP